MQPVSLTGRHGGSGVNLQEVVWSSLIFTLPDTKAKLWVCLCVCCEWNAAYINRLNLTCQTLKTTLKHHGARIATRERGEDGQHTHAHWCSLREGLPSGDIFLSLCWIFKVSMSLWADVTSEALCLRVREVVKTGHSCYLCTPLLKLSCVSGINAWLLTLDQWGGLRESVGSSLRWWSAKKIFIKHQGHYPGSSTWCHISDILNI